jgi:Tn3 transposase DDE domain
MFLASPVGPRFLLEYCPDRRESLATPRGIVEKCVKFGPGVAPGRGDGPAIDRLRIDGHSVLESDMAHLSPCRFEHINPYGKYGFEVSKNLGGAKLRPLRTGRPPA